MSIKNNIDKLLDIFPEFLANNRDGVNKPILNKKMTTLIEKINNELVMSPGTMIYYSNKNKLECAQKLTSFVWDTLDPDEIFDNISTGDDSWFMVNLLGAYSDRIKKLKPTFVSINPNNTEFEIIYNEAMRAWLFGLNNASIILCCSLIENLLKEKLYNISINEIYYTNNGEEFNAWQQKSLDQLIKNASRHEILDNETKNKAYGVKNLRNRAIHELETITSQMTLDMIYDTKRIIEKILTED